MRNQSAESYIEAVLRSDRERDIDYEYGVYFGENSRMLGDECFDVKSNDNIIINDMRYGTPSLYELIFKTCSDESIYGTW